MSKDGIKQSGNPPERDEVDDWFDALLAKSAPKPEPTLPQPQECKIEEVDLSKPGWEIRIFFDNNNPMVSDSQAEEDLETFRHFPKLCIANCKYDDRSRMAVLSYVEGCGQEELDEEHLKIISRYRHVARTLPENRRAGRKDPLESSVKSVRDSASQILAGVSKALAANPPVIHDLPPTKRSEMLSVDVPPAAESTEHQGLEVPDDILITFPSEGEALTEMLEATGCRSLNGLLERLEDIADEEELLCEHGEADGVYIVNIFKNPAIRYLKPMDAQNIAFIKKLPFEKVGLVNPNSP